MHQLGLRLNCFFLIHEQGQGRRQDLRLHEEAGLRQQRGEGASGLPVRLRKLRAPVLDARLH